MAENQDPNIFVFLAGMAIVLLLVLGVPFYRGVSSNRKYRRHITEKFLAWRSQGTGTEKEFRELAEKYYEWVCEEEPSVIFLVAGYAVLDAWVRRKLNFVDEQVKTWKNARSN